MWWLDLDNTGGCKYSFQNPLEDCNLWVHTELNGQTFWMNFGWVDGVQEMTSKGSTHKQQQQLDTVGDPFKRD
jgi:hypothetical protein